MATTTQIVIDNEVGSCTLYLDHLTPTVFLDVTKKGETFCFEFSEDDFKELSKFIFAEIESKETGK